MTKAFSEAKILNTPLGEIRVEGPVEAANLEKMFLNKKLTSFRPADRQKEALIKISKLPEGMIYAARIGREIIGYLTFHYPSGYSRWSKHPRVLELGGIEVSPDWRKNGIGTTLLRKAFTNPVVEDYIVIAIEFCWHWDLKGSGLGLMAYRRMLVNSFKSVGLENRATDDPDITEDPANVLAVYFGKNVSKDNIMLFESMLFNNRHTVEFR
ncbi:MAG: Acetoin utilization protein AcuA [Pelotomaculum sp. PtaU1.Bin035]|nr:MAG: Acetoin utilization protein AcuA [Pelotomaculum sp. PtaU1.Bin035]